jgi:phage recombination protein Bet
MTTEVATTQAPPSLLSKMAGRFHVEPAKMLSTLKATAFKGDVSNEQMMALLIVADQYGLNPWTKEIYAFPDKSNGIVPVVGVDGWARIVNTHDKFDGMEFVEADSVNGQVPAWIECIIHRKDRAHPIRVKEFYAECKRGTGPWGSHPRRMLRHKAMIQCARLAFGFVGIYDEDEAARIVNVASEPADTAPASKAHAAARKAIESAKAPKKKPEPVVVDSDPRADAIAALTEGVESAESIEALEKLRSTANGYHDDGLFTDADLAEAKASIMTRAGIIQGQEVVTA